MEIYFLRHGEAKEKKEGMKDKDRALTSFGAATIANVGRSLKKDVDNLDSILTSPLLRAAQTADIMGNVFGIKDKIVRSESLIVGAAPSALLDEIKRQKGIKRLLIIGHQPHLGMCVSSLTGRPREETDISKGGCAFVKIEDLKEGKGKLVWLKAPSDF